MRIAHLFVAAVVAAFSLAAIAQSAYNHDKPKPEQPPPQASPKSHNHFWGGVGVGVGLLLVGGGAYYVLSDHDDCSKPKAEPAIMTTPIPAPIPAPKVEAPPAVPPLATPAPMIQPKLAAAPLKPRPAPMKCEPPSNAKPKPVSSIGIRAGDGAVGVMFGHEF